MSLKDALAALFVIAIWGGNILMVKIGTTELPPLLLTGLRFVLVVALILPFRRRLVGHMKSLALLGLVMGVGHFGLLFAGIHGLGAATAAIVLQLCVPFSAILAAIIYHERLGFLGWFGMALAMAGVVVIEGGPTPPDTVSFVLVLVSALSWAVGNIIVKEMGPVDALAVTGWMGLFAAPLLLVLSALVEKDQIAAIGHAGWAGWGAVFYTAVIASVVSYTVWYRLIGRLAVNRVVPFNLLTPVIAIAGGGLLLGEPMGVATLAGAALTILGVAIIQFRPAREPKTAA